MFDIGVRSQVQNGRFLRLFVIRLEYQIVSLACGGDFPSVPRHRDCFVVRLRQTPRKDRIVGWVQRSETHHAGTPPEARWVSPTVQNSEKMPRPTRTRDIPWESRRNPERRFDFLRFSASIYGGIKDGHIHIVEVSSHRQLRLHHIDQNQ